MSIQQGDKFETAEKEIIMVTYADENKISFQFVHGSTRADSISCRVFEQLVGNTYFTKVEK